MSEPPPRWIWQGGRPDPCPREALRSAQGGTVTREHGGELWHVDASGVLCTWARGCALAVADRWDCPGAVYRFLQTGDPTLRTTAAADAEHAGTDAAWAAVWAASGRPVHVRAHKAAEQAAWAAAVDEEAQLLHDQAHALAALLEGEHQLQSLPPRLRAMRSDPEEREVLHDWALTHGLGALAQLLRTPHARHPPPQPPDVLQARAWSWQPRPDRRCRIHWIGSLRYLVEPVGSQGPRSVVVQEPWEFLQDGPPWPVPEPISTQIRERIEARQRRQPVQLQLEGAPPEEAQLQLDGRPIHLAPVHPPLLQILMCPGSHQLSGVLLYPQRDPQGRRRVAWLEQAFSVADAPVDVRLVPSPGDRRAPPDLWGVHSRGGPGEWTKP